MTFTANIGVTRPIAATVAYISSVCVFAEINSDRLDAGLYSPISEELEKQ